MNLRISQYQDRETRGQVVKIEGCVTVGGIELLEQTWTDLRKDSDGPIPFDVERVTFIDEEGARFLRQMVRENRIKLIGCRLFTQEIIECCESES